MSIQRAEQLKREWTDKFVMVQNGVPELRRFDGLAGQVKTVNMNCRLLIQFDTPADISWYDIDPQFVSVVDRDVVEESAVSKQEASATSPTDKKAAPAKPAASKASHGGGSPLDQIRASAGTAAAASTAASAGTSSNAAKTATATATEGKPAEPDSPANESSSANTDSNSRNSGSNALSAAPAGLLGTAVQTSRDSKTASASAATDADAATSESRSNAPASTGSSVAPAPAGSSARDGAAPTPFDQIRKQAEISEGGTGLSDNTGSPIFDQVKQQAAADDAFVQTDDSSLSATVDTADTSTNTNAAAASNEQPASSLMSSAASAPQPQQQQQLFDSSSGNASADPNENAGKTDSAGASKKPPSGKGADARKEIGGVEDPVTVLYRGKKLPKKDDLKIVEGIGPKIEQLFRADGIQTWRQLSEAATPRLKKILESAGPRFRMHNPETWPDQARLAAEGEWQKLEEYQDHLDGGRPPEKS